MNRQQLNRLQRLFLAMAILASIVLAPAVASAALPVTDFAANKTAGAAPLTVQFQDLSTGSPTSWAWDFQNDGVTDSTAQNPSFTYTTGGNFAVKLTATNADGSTSETKTAFISVVKADFTATPTSGAAPLSVTFTSTSTGTVTSYAWDFENDGIVDSTAQSPSAVTYSNAGNFAVSLTVTGPAGTSTTTKTSFIQVLSSPAADFSANPTSGIAPLAVTFTDQSTGNPTSWAWDFQNDSVTDSTAQNPNFTYTAGGDFTVKLTATNSAGANTTTKTSFIRAIKSNFVSNVTSGAAPLAVNFTSTATGTVSAYAWDFQNDGVTDSTVANPTFTYTGGGAFSVRLRVAGPAGTDSVTRSNFIQAFELPAANFGANVTSGAAPLTVSFTNLSTGNPTSYAWDFQNDGVTDSTATNPTFTYTSGGDFTVKLTATNSAGSNTATKTTFIRTIKADFSGTPTSGTAPLTVAFSSAASSGTITGYTWDFQNNGVPDSAVASPSFVYTTGGTYSVSLTVSGPGGNSTLVKSNYVQVFQLPVADFSSNVSSGAAPLAVTFSDLSTGNPTSWAWDFQNDGTTDSNDQNPTFTYTSGGDFNVKLTATNGQGSNIATKLAFIRTIKADFTATPTSGAAPLTVNFTNTSSGGGTLTYAWDFQNDGISDSTAISPSFPYNSSGVFTVVLTVTGPAGTSTATKTNLISVAAGPSADFTANTTSGVAPLAVTFTDQSTGNPTSWAWDFQNDGTIDSTAQNPTFTYTTGGDFNVKLTVTNVVGSNAATKASFIRVLNPDFTAAPTSGNTPLAVTFTSTSTGTITSYAWDFQNDGVFDTTTTNTSTTFTYSNSGTFSVALRVTGPAGSATATKNSLVQVSQLPVAQFSADTTSGAAPLTVNFTNLSTGNPTSFAWDFQNDGVTDSTAQGPSFTYTTGGNFTVKLVATNAAGSGTETKASFIQTIKADFTANTTSGNTPLAVTFTSTSSGTINTFAWDFNNDGVIDSSTPNTVNTSYGSGGAFSVSLTVTGPGGSSTVTKANLVQVFALPVADFTASPTSGAAPLTVTFTNQSTGNPTSYAWDFQNDATTDSTATNPTFTYTTGSNFTVKLIATNAAGSSTETKASFIRSIKADFSGTPTSGTASLTVNFTDASTPSGGISTWAWDFNNDGVTDSTSQNPSNSFTNAGTFTVKLTVTGPAGASATTKTGYITVVSAPTANFGADVTSGGAPLTVNFTNLSTGNPTTFAWDFQNDGTTDSTAANPTFTYTTGGDFTVALTATNVAGTNTATKASFIRTVKADFTATPTLGNAPLTVNFTNTSSGGGALTYAWDFQNDGVTDSTVTSPSFTYNSAGAFSVKLSTTGTAGTSTVVKSNLIQVAGALNSLSLSPTTATLFGGATQVFTATALDQSSLPLSGLTVTFSPGFAGAFSLTSVVTNAAGQASATLAAGGLAGTFTISAQATQGLTIKSATASVTVNVAVAPPPVATATPAPTATPIPTSTPAATPTPTTPPTATPTLRPGVTPTPTPLAPPVTKQVNAGDGAVVATKDNTVQVAIPRNPLSEPIIVALAPVAVIPSRPPEGVGVVGRVFTVDIQQQSTGAIISVTLAQAAVITVTYTDDDLKRAGITDASQLTLYRFDNATKSWQVLPTTVDTATRTVTARTTQFSTFALMAQGAKTPSDILVGDYAPTTSVLIALLLAGAALVAAGFFVLRRRRA